ncbi:hypothetical protein P3T76_012379 [Phytophthora citrophthora]|uniref:Transmembrane protein n=1 Tax=Phytophthora citrophthora TaxID=4793 RepID=A0AAD9G5T3_9STRA|nr:hypothetical protein P3T76_012379 [Phytophthora citrophthora]
MQTKLKQGEKALRKESSEQRTLQEKEKHVQLQEPVLATEATEQKPTPSYSPACAQEVAAYCQKESNVVALLREAPDMVEPRKIVDAVRKVRLCMVSHADVLSVDCVNTLSADAVGAVPTMAASVPAKTVPVALDDDDGVNDDSSMEINIYYSRHHNGAGHALRSGGALAANHVQTGGPASNLAEVLAHPLTWVFVLPFFAIGMYVSITRVATFLRRRREERRIESKQYMPVN